MTHLFAPVLGSTAVQSATTTSAATKLGAQPKAGEFQVRCYNDGSTLAYIEFGQSDVVATTSSMPLPAGVLCGFTITNPAKSGDWYFAAKMASSTANVSVTVGHGI